MVLLYCVLHVIGLKTRAPTQPIRCKTETNRDLVARVFPRLASVIRVFALFYFVLFTFVAIRLRAVRQSLFLSDRERESRESGNGARASGNRPSGSVHADLTPYKFCVGGFAVPREDNLD